MNEVLIAVATPEDAGGITEVRRKTWLATYPNEEFGITKVDIESSLNLRTIAEETERTALRLGTRTDVRNWVAKDDATVIGFIAAIQGKERNRISALYILPEYQGQGIGTRLMNSALEWLGNEKEIYFEVVTYNASAISFYKRFGFVENGQGHNEIAKLPTGKELPEIEMVKKLQ